MTPEAIKKLQTELKKKGAKISITGVLDEATLGAMQKAVTQAIASNKKIQASASPDQILGAYTSGDWNGITDLTGRPFTSKDVRAAEKDAERALAPGFREQESYDTAVVEDSLRQNQEDFGNFLKTEGEAFETDKGNQDQNAADSGVLFSGARFQKLNDLKKTYDERQAIRRNQFADNIGSTARNFQYQYGDKGANKISSFYRLPDANTYNPGTTQKMVTPGMNLSSVYDPAKYNFQGTTVNANKAAVQTRAAGLLANRANKLTASGYKTKF